jgi:hypothetical protein
MLAIEGENKMTDRVAQKSQAEDRRIGLNPPRRLIGAVRAAGGWGRVGFKCRSCNLPDPVRATLKIAETAGPQLKCVAAKRRAKKYLPFPERTASKRPMHG